MTKTGRLKRSIRKMASGLDYVIIGSDVPYAKIHNEGGKSQKSVYVSSHTRKKTIPKSVNLRTRKASRKRVDTGETIKVKSHTRKMNLFVPKRQFMGKSRPQYRNELLELYKQISYKNSIEEMEKSVDAVVNIETKQIYMHLSRIKTAFYKNISSSIASEYCVVGYKNEPKFIPIKRKLVIWEEK